MGVAWHGSRRPDKGKKAVVAKFKRQPGHLVHSIETIKITDSNFNNNHIL